MIKSIFLLFFCFYFENSQAASHRTTVGSVEAGNLVFMQKEKWNGLFYEYIEEMVRELNLPETNWNLVPLNQKMNVANRNVYHLLIVLLKKHQNYYTVPIHKGHFIKYSNPKSKAKKKKIIAVRIGTKPLISPEFLDETEELSGISDVAANDRFLTLVNLDRIDGFIMHDIFEQVNPELYKGFEKKVVTSAPITAYLGIKKDWSKATLVKEHVEKKGTIVDWLREKR